MDFFTSVEFYDIVKYLHVVAAVCWVGGGAVLMYLAALAARAKDDAGQMAVMGQMNSLAMIWFIPASLSTVIFGAIATTVNGYWGHAWIILGLIGFAATFVTGNFFIKPTGEKIGKFAAAGNMTAALGAGKKLLTIAKFDYVMLFVVIFDMVFKPEWSDIWELAVMAIVLVIGAVLFLIPGLRMKTASA